MGVVEDLGDRLAVDVIEAMKELGDDRFFDKISKVLLDASPTMQEAFLTAYRVRIAETRGRAYIDAALKAKREGREGPKIVMDSSGH